MTLEQFFPTRWVIRGIACRSEFAQHLRRLRRTDKQLARKCIGHAYWVGVYPNK
jgi:hypothetical protein